jgi:zinc/manganese transport system substrate-binding protein
MTKTVLVAGAAMAFCAFAAPALADPVKIVAAENFYGDIATQIGGANVAVTSILSNPDDDPHLFEASASTAKALADAKIVIVNGADYDPWMEKLLGANKVPGRREIMVATLARKNAGDNPHLWYNPATVMAAANALSVDLAMIDPTHRADYQKGGAAFAASLEPLEAKIAEMRKKYAGQPIAASEPVFGYMAELLGLKVHDEKFALAVMNNTEPSASDVAGFEDDLKGHKVKAMLYNAQASEPTVQRLVQVAKDEKIPVVGVSETEPAGANYQQWMGSQLDALDRALAGGAS